MSKANESLPEIEFTLGTDLPSLIQQYGRERAEQRAYLQDDGGRTWSEFASNVNRVANGLHDLGVRPNDRVALMGRNSLEFAELFFGILSLGACTVPLGTMISSDSLKLMLEDSEARVLVVSDAYRSLADPIIDSIKSLLPGGKIGFDFGADEGGPNHWHHIQSALYHESNDRPAYRIKGDEDFNIIYSSGTTGVPKGITHSHRIRSSAYLGMSIFEFDTNTINLISTPMYSNTTLVTWLSTVAVGGECVLMKKFDADRALKIIQDQKISHAMFVPVQYDRMLRVPRLKQFDLSSMRWKFCTSAPLRPSIKRQLIDSFPGELIEFYGLTEGGVGTVNFVNHNITKLDSVGIAGEGSELKIVDDQGNELPVGQVGEIVGRSATMCKGYVNRQEATQDMHWYDKNGRLFYRTGDIGRLDSEGFLFLSDRKKDMIISGGLNVYATDLEVALLDHSAVHEAAVIAIPSDEWGETPLALVVKEKGATETTDSICEWVNERLGKSQRISAVEYRQELPKSPIGKVLKKELRQPYWNDASIT